MSVTDRYAAIACDHCGETIDESLELAGKIEYRLDGKVALHPGCAAEYDADAPALNWRLHARSAFCFERSMFSRFRESGIHNFAQFGIARKHAHT